MGDASGLVKDRSFQSLVQNMDNDARAAEQQWKSQAGNSVFAGFPAVFLARYRADGTELLKRRGDFNAEWNRVVLGRGDPKKLLAACDAYSLNLGALQESNTCIKALIDVNAASRAGGLLKTVSGVIQALPDVFERELKLLQPAPVKAEKDVSDAKLKRALNVAASAVTFVLVPETALVRAVVAVGGITAHLIVDNALGHGTAKGGAVFVVGDGVEAIKKLGEGGKKLVGGLAAVTTFKFDSHEVREAQQVVERLRPMIARTISAYKDFMAKALQLAPRLQALEVGIKALTQEIKTALTKGKDAAKNYDAVRNSIKKAL
jgi:hypothetical protein